MMWFSVLLWVWLAVAVAVFFVLLKINVPFGKFTSSTWGMRISNRSAWFIMEIPALLAFPLVTLGSPQWSNLRGGSIDIIFLTVTILWVTHYAHRGIIYPARIHLNRNSVPIAVVAVALFYNLVNGFFLGYYYGWIYVPSELSILMAVRVGCGLLLFLAGLIITIYHDQLLINIRRTTTNGTYAIPTGGLFNRISTPNLFGETLEWFGFVLIAWSLPALAMAMWTAANLIPRAYNIHSWYQRRFADYPAERRPFFPAFRLATHDPKSHETTQAK